MGRLLDKDGNDTGTKAGKPAKPELPPLRTFKVTRLAQGEAMGAARGTVESILVYAHQINFDVAGILVFQVFVVFEDGSGTIHIPRAFRDWIDFEEILLTNGQVH